MRKLFSVLVLCCFLLCGSCSSAEIQKYEYTSGPFHYSVRSDWYYDSSEENNIHSNTHMRDKNDPFTGLIMVDTVSSPLVSAADSISSVLDPFSIFSALDPFPDYDDTLLSSLIGGTAAGLKGTVESSSREIFDHISGRVFSVYVEEDDLHYAGFAAYEKDTFLMMLYCDNRRDPEKLMTRLKEELIPTVWVDE